MSHRISYAEAVEKYNREKEIQELIKQGKYKSNRWLRKKKMKEFKELTFIDKLKIRGGYGPDIRKKREEEKKKQEDKK